MREDSVAGTIDNILLPVLNNNDSNNILLNAKKDEIYNNLIKQKVTFNLFYLYYLSCNKGRYCLDRSSNRS